MEIWKIRQISTGLFSGGGNIDPYSGGWCEKGKNWNKLGHLKNHLNLGINFYRRHQDDIEVVKMELVVCEKDTISMKELLDAREKKNKAKEAKYEKARRESRLIEIEREKVKLEDELKKLKK